MSANGYVVNVISNVKDYQVTFAEFAAVVCQLTVGHRAVVSLEWLSYSIIDSFERFA
jgi:hypothetical protein